MFITGPSIIEWSLVSSAPEAAASSQWERRPFKVLLLLALFLLCSCIVEEKGRPSVCISIGGISCVQRH